MKSLGTDQRIARRIASHGRGWVFSARDFLDLGSRAAIDQVLSRRARQHRIRKIARGLYDLPMRHPTLGILAPKGDAIARALAGRDAARLQVSGALAANLLGLSTQVPARSVYLTDGATRKVQIGKRQILLRRSTPRNLATAGRPSGTLIQALRWLGKDHVDDSTVAQLRRRLPAEVKAQLVKDARYAPAWIAAVMRRVALPETN